MIIFDFPLLFFPYQSRQELEQHSVDTASTSDAVNFITYVQTLKRKIKQFEKNVDVSIQTFGSLQPSRRRRDDSNQRPYLFILSCSVMDSVCWRSRGSSSHHLGSTLTTSKVNGVPSVTSWNGRTLPSNSKWPTYRWRLYRRTKQWRTGPLTCSMTGKRQNQLL